jgi:hypothetical protein
VCAGWTKTQSCNSEPRDSKISAAGVRKIDSFNTQSLLKIFRKECVQELLPEGTEIVEFKRNRPSN